MAEIRYLVRQVAPSNASVLVTGPSGSGKEMVARAVHAESARVTGNYVAVNTGAIPRELLESELFGHEKGSFTGAVSQKSGRFEEAHGGTLFLDEIGDMPFEMQVKLLRVLEERSVQRVGGRGEITVDTRIVSATHRDIEQSIADGRFREDLFYRLAVFPIDLPSLAERREDVPLLVRHFLAQSGNAVRFDGAAIDRLVAHPWPGNVRELRNVVERGAILFAGQTIGAEQTETILSRRVKGFVRNAAPCAPGVAEGPASCAVTPIRPISVPRASELPFPFPGAEADEAAVGHAPTPNPSPLTEPVAIAQPDLIRVLDAAFGDTPVDLRQLVCDLEARYISEALRQSEGVVADAARLLSLQRTTLIEKMRKHGLAKAA
ncbi:sigma-54-dependent Fis family transcriptional regulator [Sphingomonas deserti]|uniref:Sigma-54-dependent Fis family transcriptional regulator n=2 Tax=Allosphingosinicella deserti TaxID=2116704 RepID=A0A2P7QJH3_9SPHN|nr:sigma-54-dependent Fis family transcriptional regulator [Sphingomonas deserti]